MTTVEKTVEKDVPEPVKEARKRRAAMAAAPKEEKPEEQTGAPQTIAPSVEESRFSCKTASPKEWKVITTAAKMLIEEFTIEADEAGVRFAAMDPPHIEMLVLTWPREGFESYVCPKKTTLTLRMEDFQKLISRARDSDAVELFVRDNDSVGLRLVGPFTKSFVLHTLELGQVSKTPEMELTSSFEMAARALETFLSDLAIVGDQVKLSASSDALRLSAKSDVGEGEMVLARDTAELLSIKTEKIVSASYNIGYIVSMLKACGKEGDVVRARFNSRKPIELTFPLNDQGAKLQFYLAPRIAED